MRAKKIFILIILAIIVVVAGAWRQIVFININALVAVLEGRLTNSGLVSALSFLADWNLSSLKYLKWFMTVFFSLFFLSISSYILWVLFHDFKVIKLLIFSYIGIFIISGLFFTIGRYTNYADIGYTIARRCMGALQSPFPVMFLIGGYQLSQQSE